MKIVAFLAASLALTGCDPRPDIGPVYVSVVGEPGPRGHTSVESERVLAGALSEGLVRFDAAGQIEAGLAERWIVIDGGLRYIFRLRPARWSDGRSISAAEVVAILKRRLRAPGPLTPYLTAIDDIVEMTPQVLEVRLDRPRPDLLKLFAQPELGVGRSRPRDGGGPFRLAGDGRLTPVRDPASDDDERPRPENDVRLTIERAALAIARFTARRSDLVLGGTIADWPLVTVAGVAPANLRIDPAAGLFGLAVVRREGLLTTSAGRAAIASAFDRATIVVGLAPAMAAAETVLPEPLDAAAAPTQPGWAASALAERRGAAVTALAVLRGSAASTPTLSIALPAGPGGRLLFRLLRADLRTVGVDAFQVAMDDRSADLRLIDQVAPYDSARWYLRTACAPCSADAEAAIEVARLARTPAERARALAAADSALTADAAFIPIARPLRWSLVALRLAQFQGNPRAWHPLDHLRNEPDR